MGRTCKHGEKGLAELLIGREIRRREQKKTNDATSPSPRLCNQIKSPSSTEEEEARGRKDGLQTLTVKCRRTRDGKRKKQREKNKKVNEKITEKRDGRTERES